MPDRIVVTSAEFVRSIGRWQREALEQVVTITHHGHERLVLVSSKRFERAEGALDATMQAPALGGPVFDQAEQHDWLLDHVQVGYVLFDRALNIVRANPAAHGLLGVAKEKAPRSEWAEALPSATSAAIADFLQTVLRDGQFESMECDPEDFGGRHLILGAGPCAPGVAMLITGRTAEALALQRLNDNEALRSALTQFQCIGEADLSQFARIERLDALFARTTGFIAADLVGRRFIDILPLARRRAFSDAFENLFHTRAPTVLETELVYRQGATEAVSISMALNRNEGVKLLVQWPFGSGGGRSAAYS